MHQASDRHPALSNPLLRGLDVYVINLDSAPDRLAHITRIFDNIGLGISRIPALDGTKLQLPLPEYSEFLFRWFHGRETNRSEIGCYLSHLAAFSAFLQSGQKYALVCEDDIVLRPDFEQAVAAALHHAEDWDILRLSGLARPKGLTLRRFSSGHRLAVLMERLKGAGAYLINASAAARLRQSLLPMRLPFDHALDREWFDGLRAAALLPFPVSQTERLFRSSIQGGKARRLGWRHRLFTTYPYQALNELSRYGARACQFFTLRLRPSPGYRAPGDAPARYVTKNAPSL